MDRRSHLHLDASITWKYWFFACLMSVALALAGAAGPRARPAAAQMGGSGSFTHDTAADFGAACATLAGAQVSDANGGEVRLAATVEDYFLGSAPDTTRWLTGTVYSGPAAPIVVANGVLTLDSAYLRSQLNFNGVRPRFFEARALLRAGAADVAATDLGFYREDPPLAGIYPATSAMRIFVSQDNTTVYTRARDGDSNAPAYDTYLNGFDTALTQVYRIEWEAAQTRFYVDGVLRATVDQSIDTLDTWAFLYHQEPSTSGRSPMQVDWVRAGQYPANGVYASCALDSAQFSDWTTWAAQIDLPAGASVTVNTRSSLDGVNWSGWEPVSGGVIASPDGRYLQYQLQLATTNVLLSPEVREVVIGYAPSGQPTPVPTPTPTPTDGPTPTSTPTPAVPGGQTIVHDSLGDFSPGCAARTDTFVSDAAGGEVRLAATLEDYFNGSAVDAGRWLAGSTYDWYQVPPSVAGGVLTLDAAYLRSQINFQSVAPRFFEARALQRVTDGNAGWPDLGFYRELPPLAYGDGPFPNDSSLRIFITRDTNTTFARGRDGDGNQPLIDVDLPTLDLTQYHLFRLEWDATETRFYTDGTLQATIPGIATLNTWAFLYHQTPASFGASPMQVDWVRAGAYPASGTYTSCALDAGAAADWQTLTATTVTPAGTGVAFETRSSEDGLAWSDWTALSGQTIVSPFGRFLQYRMTLTSGDLFQSPEVQQVSITYDEAPAPTGTPTATTTPTDTPTSTLTPTPTATDTPTPTDTPTATDTPTSTATPTPAVNGGLQFDGTNDLARAGAIPGTGPLTVEAWVRPGAANESGVVIANGNDFTGWSLELTNGRLTAWVATNLGWRMSQHTTVLASGQWYHVAMTYAGGSLRTYVNGVASAATSVGTLTQGPSVSIGGLAGYPYYNGVIDEIRVSNVARYTGNFTPPGTFGNDANTLALWRLDELSGQTAADASASGNTVTLGTAAGADTADPLWVGVTR